MFRVSVVAMLVSKEPVVTEGVLPRSPAAGLGSANTPSLIQIMVWFC